MLAPTITFVEPTSSLLVTARTASFRVYPRFYVLWNCGTKMKNCNVSLTQSMHNSFEAAAVSIPRCFVTELNQGHKGTLERPIAQMCTYTGRVKNGIAQISRLHVNSKIQNSKIQKYSSTMLRTYIVCFVFTRIKKHFQIKSFFFFGLGKLAE